MGDQARRAVRQPGVAALVPLLFSVLLSSLGTSIANVALPALAHGFEASIQAAQWVVIAYLLGTTSLTLGAGWISDLVGGRRLLAIGLAIFAAASAAAGAAPSLGFLIGVRALQGIGAAIMLTVPLALASEVVADSRRGRTIGAIGAMSAAGTAIGPSLGGILLDSLGWRSIFLASTALAAVTLLLLLTNNGAAPARTVRPAPAKGMNWLGFVLLMATLAAATLAITLGGGRLGRVNLALALLALASASGLVSVERHAVSPILRLSQFRDAGVTLNLASTTLVAAVVAGTLVVGPFYLMAGIGLRPAAIGLAMAVGPSVVVLGSIAAGKLASHADRRTNVAGSGLMLAGCTLLATVAPAAGLLGYLLSVAILTFGYALFQTSNNKLVMDRAPTGDKGVFAGMLNLSRNVGATTGTALLAAVFAFRSGGSGMAALTAQSAASGMQGTFAAAALLALSALLTTALTWKAPNTARARQ